MMLESGPISTKSLSSLPMNRGMDIPMATTPIMIDIRHDVLAVNWVNSGFMMHRYRSTAMAMIAKEDMKIGVACPAAASRHNHSVSRPKGHFLFKTYKCELDFT